MRRNSFQFLVKSVNLISSLSTYGTACRHFFKHQRRDTRSRYEGVWMWIKSASVFMKNLQHMALNIKQNHVSNWDKIVRDLSSAESCKPLNFYVLKNKQCFKYNHVDCLHFHLEIPYRFLFILCFTNYKHIVLYKLTVNGISYSFLWLTSR